jgi:hypothetical protein
MTTTVVRLTVKLDLTIETEGRPDRELLLEQVLEDVTDAVENMDLAGGEVENANPERDPVDWTVEQVECVSVTTRGR